MKKPTVEERMSRYDALTEQGAVITDPLTTYIAENAVIGTGTVIHPLTVIEGGVVIGRDCEIGPFARIRSGVIIGDDVCIGNFVEVVRSEIRGNTKIKHLTYIGDSVVEEDVNVGAGTVVANYDGKLKNRTRIRKGAFIGSGSILIAPVTVGNDSVTGAGAVVTKNRDIPDGTTVVGIPAKPLKTSTSVTR